MGNGACLGGLEGIVLRELHREKEHAAGEGAIGGPHECGGPVEEVVPLRTGAAVRRRIATKVLAGRISVRRRCGRTCSSFWMRFSAMARAALATAHVRSGIEVSVV